MYSHYQAEWGKGLVKEKDEFFCCEKIVCAVYNLGPSLVHLCGGRPVIRRASSLWVMEFIVETTLEVPQKCGHKTNSAHQYLPAAL